ncbi:shugoshin-1-like isoform X2 [Amaranthus tricolor]|nr:shugoshin-1-like isoform X2 [Amaranthus tricolor]XP_057528066.1 shugoshin-1-like isoform X2 [Amaranthus tricolor]XP_057528067.1 shugoshin-1-like isoform X2 [Amaranthus tricolor]
MRKRLSDITNLHSSQHKSPFKKRENLLPAVEDVASKSYIDNLVQENAVMMKLIEEKDKIIESNGVKMQELTVNLQKTQLQNWHLAQSNSHMSAELNRAKDRLRLYEHELVCKDAVIKATTLKLKEKAKLHSETNTLQEKAKMHGEINSLQEGETTSKVAAVEQPMGDDNDNNKNRVSKPKRRLPTRSRSMGPTRSQQIVDKETAENKRRCLRRQSGRLASPKEGEDFFELDVSDNHVNQASNISHRKSTGSQDLLSEASKSGDSQRLSIGRPQRRAAVKVQSYKDPPLNSKMRRPA